MRDQIVILDKKDNRNPKCGILHTNEDSIFYFMEIKSVKKIPKGKRMLSKILSKEITSHDPVFSKKYLKEYTGVLYQTHTLVELLDLRLAQLMIRRGEEMLFELDTTLSTYNGHTIFSIFIEEPEVYKQILRQYEMLEFPPEENSEKKMVENSVLRRLYRILEMPTAPDKDIDFTNKDINCKICV